MGYFLFTSLLALVMAGIIFYYFNPKRKERIEEPKHRMLEDDK
ncbi:MAG: cbb3-type cytochrome c oxidase subunit 3 [Chlorobium sp.]